MTYKFKSLFKFITFEVPNNLHNKLIYTKYIILTAIVISAIYTSGNNLLLEFEPFKTIIEWMEVFHFVFNYQKVLFLLGNSGYSCVKLVNR